MNFQEAFSSVEHLPARDRVLLGSFDGEDFRWSASSVDVLDLFDGFETTNEVSEQLARAVDEFRFGDAQSAVVIMKMAGRSYIALVLGPTDPSSVSDMLVDASKDLIAQYAH